MSNRFEYVEFTECDVNDSFFDSLKMDYPEFESWFQRKSKEHTNEGEQTPITHH